MAGTPNGDISHTVSQQLPWPTDFCYIFSIQEVEPDFEKQPPRNPGGHWAPPNKTKGIKHRGNPHRFRWRAGTPEPVTLAEYTNLTSGQQPFDAATVFVTDSKFRAVPFNAKQQSVINHHLGEWMDISFQYVRLTPPSQPLRLFSQVDFAGAHVRLAAQGQSPWINDLFPHTYRWRPQDAAFANAANAGLVGKLSLILALAAFACPPQQVGHYIRHCVRRQQWAHHPQPHGREEYRGYIVTVHLDPGSSVTREQLNQFQQGHYGAFFRA